MSTITLASKNNGVGLSVDMGLLEEFLIGEGHTVRRVDWEEDRIESCDLIIFLELFSPRLMSCARKSVFIPNLEWMLSDWIPDLRRVDQIWAKSETAYRILQGLKFPVTRTGFLTRDLFDGTVPKQLSCLHLKGRSEAKNSEAVFEAWFRFGSMLPPLTVIAQNIPRAPIGANVRVVGRLTEKEIVRELNAHRIHVCPSKVEGWGHYITEGLTCRSVVITSDDSPMNEHVQPRWGFLVPPYGFSPRAGTFVREIGVDPEKIAAAVMEAAALPERRIAEMGRIGRGRALRRNRQFIETVRPLLADLLDKP